jgi:RNA polymerase sigma-70 factor (ECF subfamily)
VSRPRSRPRGLDALREELVRYHTDPHALPFAEGPFGELGGALPAPRAGLADVVPLRPELAPEPDPAPAAEEPVEPDVSVVTLVAAAQAGDPEAFGQLYDRYLDLVYRYVYYRVGSKALAEDLVSETFLRALRRIGTFEWQGRDFAAWLITIARNIIADHFKSGRFRLEVSTADMLDADRATDGPESEVLDGITNASLLEAVKRLNGEQQECVVLRFLQGLSVLETAQAMGKTEGAIKALQYRAVRTLGRMLPKELIL